MIEHQNELILHRLMTIRKRMVIEDISGQKMYSVQPKIVAATREYIVSNVDGNTVAKIQQKLSLITPKYKVSVTGRECFEIKRNISLLHNYSIKGMPWVVEGDFSSFNYRVLDSDGNNLCEIRKELNRWDDRYYLRICDNQYIIHGICIALSIDAALYAIRSNK